MLLLYSLVGFLTQSFTTQLPTISFKPSTFLISNDVATFIEVRQLHLPTISLLPKYLHNLFLPPIKPSGLKGWLNLTLTSSIS